MFPSEIDTSNYFLTKDRQHYDLTGECVRSHGSNICHVCGGYDRAELIRDILASEPMTDEEYAALSAELETLKDNAAADDYADAQMCARFGTGL